jgi:predicted DNA-binding mobile mystery protein A
MKQQRLQLDQLEKKLKVFIPATKMIRPVGGWTKSIRTTLGMSLKQLADKLQITKQSMQEIELREQKETISIKTLREVAHAMEMDLVYGFVPKDGSLHQLIDRKAKELAIKIVSRTEQTMKLENQTVHSKRIKSAIKERMDLIKKEMPKTLWN